MQNNIITALAKRQTLFNSPQTLDRSDVAPASYAVDRIARRARVSLPQAALIAELLGLSQEAGHG